MNFPCENYLRFTFNFFSYLFLHFLLGTFPFTFLHLRPTIMIISPAGKMMAELVMPIIAFNFMIFVHCCACLSWLHGKMPSHFLTGISCGILPISFLPGLSLYIRLPLCPCLRPILVISSRRYVHGMRRPFV